MESAGKGRDNWAPQVRDGTIGLNQRDGRDKWSYCKTEKGTRVGSLLHVLAESEGFKPPIPEKGIPDFESSAIDHSANSPSK